MPIVTLDVLKVGIEDISDLGKLYKWIASLIWLPQHGVHFSMTDEELTISSASIHRPGFFLNVNGQAYLEHLHASAQAAL